MASIRELPVETVSLLIEEAVFESANIVGSYEEVKSRRVSGDVKTAKSVLKDGCAPLTVFVAAGVRCRLG